MRRLLARCAVAILLLACCLGMGRRPGVSDDEYLAAARELPWVVAIESPSTRRAGTERGSGVVIASRWVLTAGHVVADMSLPVVQFRGRPYVGQRVITHPQYRPTPDSTTGDLALIELRDAVPLEAFPALGTTTVGDLVDVVGCGTHGVAGNSQRSFDKRCRAGTQLVDQISGGVIYTSMSPANETPRECVLTGGDSGGGLFRDGELVGVHLACEGHTADVGGYGDRNAHTCVETYRHWITEQTSQPSGEDGRQRKKRFRKK